MELLQSDCTLEGNKNKVVYMNIVGINVELAKNLEEDIKCKSNDEIFNIIKKYVNQDKKTTMLYIYWYTDFSRVRLNYALGYNSRDSNYLRSEGLIEPITYDVKCLNCEETRSIFVDSRKKFKQILEPGSSNICPKCELSPTAFEKYYQEYLKTEQWKAVKRIALDIAGDKCQLCSSSDGELNVHHNSYKNLKKETMKDLIVLCDKCHTKHHVK
jgi:hypothetical protein